MQKSREFFINKFNEFNKLIFGARLPMPRILLSDAATFLGKCCYRSRKSGSGRPEHFDFTLRFSIRHSMPDTIWEDVVIHEMIHYYIAYAGIEDRSSHGPIFRRIMKEINVRYNRHISISHKVVLSANSEMKDINSVSVANSVQDSSAVRIIGKRRVRVVARLEFADGKVALKVLPRVVPTIRNYYKAWIRQTGVTEIRFYVSDNTFFNHYPSSGALRAYPCEKNDLDSALADALPLRINLNSF